MPVRFESAGASALHTPLPFGFNPWDARDRSLICRGVLVTQPFRRPVGAQSTTQPWRVDPLIPFFLAGGQKTQTGMTHLAY